MIHEVRNVGDAPLDNFILEFLPEKRCCNAVFAADYLPVAGTSAR
jgi:hypothetical protein